jgi:hypothetical protein
LNIVAPVTRDEAIAEAKRQQHRHPDAKWVATQRNGEWALARIGLAPSTVTPTATATEPPPVTPRDDPQSPLQRVTTLFGSPG